MSDYRDSTPPNYSGIMTAAAVMAVTGWVGLWMLVTTMLPTAFPRWLFFVFLYLAVTGTVLPFVRFLNARFTRDLSQSPSDGIVLRQSIWVGLFVVACAWLQIPRVLSPLIAGFLALSLVAVEVVLHLREQDQGE
ncbi:MAG: hypothetical protein JXA10_16405 [Anaerolineae bacterium]|nr:hypothetical protein [Anaerolineae bacterium]